MESTFVDFLTQKGFSERVIRNLEAQEIFSLRSFKLLRREHFLKMLEDGGLSVGAHALLWDTVEQLRKPVLESGTYILIAVGI